MKRNCAETGELGIGGNVNTILIILSTILIILSKFLKIKKLTSSMCILSVDQESKKEILCTDEF